MKMLWALFAALCFTGAVMGKNANDDCTDTPDCANSMLICQNSKCRIKLGKACVKGESFCVVGAVAPCGDSLVCECETGKKTPSADDTKCLVMNNQECTDNDECIADATCTTNAPRKCMCPRGATTENDVCLKKAGDDCKEKQCLANGECKDAKCACKANFLATYNKEKCLKAPGQTCDPNANECGLNAECKDADKKCTCKPNFKSKDDDSYCGKTESVNCNPGECGPHSTCSAGKCKCMDDYTADGDGFCSGASSVVTSLLLMLAAFVVSRWL